MPIQSGALAGLANLRDNVAVTYQTQLDQTAQGLIDFFAETDFAGSGTTLAGLFTNAGSTAIPSPTSDVGLAGTIAVNAAVDPNQGGNPQLLGNGINYNFNTGNDASYGGQLQQLLTNLSTNQTYNGRGPSRHERDRVQLFDRIGELAQCANSECEFGRQLSKHATLQLDDRAFKFHGRQSRQRNVENA